MASNLFSRSLPKTLSIASFLSRSYYASSSAATAALVNPRSSSLSILRRLRRPLAGASAVTGRSSPALTLRCLSSNATSSSLKDPNPNWSNRPPKETILLDGCDFEHWLVVMEPPEGDPTRDDIIDSYIKTLAMVVGSEQEARMKIYSVSTRCYFAFGALVSEELSYKLKELPKVRWVLPDSYLDVKNKDYGGEPFINGEAVPYDPKYHEEWIRNNARANERNRRNDRPRTFDRSRNFERRRENMPPPNNDFQRGPPPPPGANMGPPPPGGNMGQPPPNYQRGPPPPPLGGNMGPPPPHHMGPPPPNYQRGPPPPPPGGNMGPPPPNMGGYQQNGYNGMPPPPPQNNWNDPRNNYGGPPPQGNMGGMPPPPPPPQHNNEGGWSGPNNFTPNRDM